MFPPLFTGHLLRLTAPLPEDREIFAAWSLNDEYLRLMDDDPIRPQPVADFSSFGEATERDSYYFHLRTLQDDRLIGFVVLFDIKWRNQSAVLSIGIGEPEYWGKGYGSDALKLILNYAFSELGLYRVGLWVMDYNTRAIKAYERAGFVREGASRGMVLREGQRYDLIHYGILRAEWQALRQ